jgi:hypothetical protein
MQAAAIASAGITAAVARFDASARRTAQAPLDDIAGEAVERLQAAADVRVNAAVLRTADDMTGALLDILA